MYSNVMSFIREMFAHCFTWPNAHPKFAHTCEEIASQNDTHVTFAHQL